MDKGWMGIRASDADRAEVANLLKEAAAEGRLTIDEISERIGEVMNSKTYADLHWCLRELPAYESYKPLHKIIVSDAQVVSQGAHRRRGGMGMVVPVAMGMVVFMMLSALSGLVATFFLFPVQIIFYVVLMIIVFKMLRVLILHRRS
jgi:hypothetical protein